MELKNCNFCFPEKPLLVVVTKRLTEEIYGPMTSEESEER